jgi:hypothetical protein
VLGAAARPGVAADAELPLGMCASRAAWPGDGEIDGIGVASRVAVERPVVGGADDVGIERLQAATQQTATEPARRQRYWSWGMGLFK